MVASAYPQVSVCEMVGTSVQSAAGPGKVYVCEGLVIQVGTSICPRRRRGNVLHRLTSSWRLFDQSAPAERKVHPKSTQGSQ